MPPAVLFVNVEALMWVVPLTANPPPLETDWLPVIVESSRSDHR